MRSLKPLSPHSLFHFVQLLEIPVGVAGHSQGVVRRTVHSAAGHILVHCTDRIGLAVGHLAVAAPVAVEIVVLVVAVAAKEATVAAAGLAALVAVVVEVESVVQLGVRRIDVEASPSVAVPSDVAADKVVSVDQVELVAEIGPGPGHEQTHSVHLMRSEKISLTRASARTLNGPPLALVVVLANLEVAVDMTDIAPPVPSAPLAPAAAWVSP
mmetsp:Transcript_15665/g.28301  ORF Transcript_15665/g.28301 Transcript_15665/m.28301 type:complete len:212 (+) Transcript_15665:721-1356(+)